MPPNVYFIVKVTPEESAPLFSKLTFSWLTSLLSKGARTPLTMDDLWQLRDIDSSKDVVDRFQKAR